VERHDDVQLDDLERRWLDHYDRFAGDPQNYLEMSLAPGDMQFLSNHSIAHARTAYQDDPDKPRHLLRLWLSLDDAED
jgi:alpha-ketoglutarate-dependent taurine dioxygenase